MLRWGQPSLTSALGDRPGMSDRTKHLLAMAIGLLVMVAAGLRYKAGADRADAEARECMHSLVHLVEAKIWWGSEHHAVVRSELGRPGIS